VEVPRVKVQGQLENQNTARTIERLLDVDRVAQLLAVPRSWIYRRLRTRGPDRLPGFRLGKYWRFREADLQEWIERMRRA
jgi:excisionase family DNA binding protein